MWFVKYGDKYLHDPRVSVFVTDASLSPEVNTSGEFKFTITKKHPLYESLREHDMDNEIAVYDDDELIFCGTIVEIDKDFQLTADVTCQSEMAYLNKSLIPPFSTLSTETGETAPDNLAEFFEWLIEKHNSQVDAKRQFVVGRNDGDAISGGTFYLSSDSYSATGAVIKDSILENYTSYITIEHEDDKRVVNLLKDFDPVNAQVIDFGVNLLDFTDGVVSDEVYTVMVPLGAAMKDTEYAYFDGYSLTEDKTPNSSKQYYNHDTYTQATLKNVGTEDAPVYKFESGVRYFEKVAKYAYTYAPWNSCNPNVTYYYNNKLTEKKNLYYFEYGVQYFEKRANGTYFKTGDRTPNWDKTYYRYDYSSVSDLKHFSRWEDGDRSGYDYYTRKASEFYIATGDSTPVHGKTYYTSPSSVSYTACDTPLLKFDPLKSYFEYDAHADESNNKLTISAGQFETQLEDGYIKTGDKIVATDAVKKYGLMSTTYENTDIKTREDLEKYGLIALKATVSPVRSLEIKAIDLAMIKPDYEPIKIGQYIRARSKPHGLDSYFLCSKIDYDLNNPDNTTFTLGTTFDTLTGQQNKRIKYLNSITNTIYEAAAKISDDAKANAIIAGQSQEKIDDASAKADDAAIKADEAQTKADEAQTKADEAQTKADEAQSKADSAVSDAKDAADKAADAAKKADDATANVTLIQNRITTIEGSTAEAVANAAAAKEAADSAKADAEAASTAASNAQSAAESAQSKADEAYTAAGNVASQVENINSEITDIKKDATDLRDDLEGRIETVTSTMTADYAKKTELSSVESSLKSEISTSAAGIKSEVSQTYATKNELTSSISDLTNTVETNYSTKSEVSQLSDQVSSTVSAVSEAKTTAAAAQDTANKANAAAATAQTAADTAKANAATAQTAADAAKTAADTAQSKANEAAENLATAEKNLQDLQSQADATDEQLSAAKTAVANAKKAADDAQSAADTAKANAATAQTTADTAKANAATAQTTADTAKTAADKAQADVDALTDRVSTAETSIIQNADAIALRATKTEVSTAIDNVRIGGRNLLLNTNTDKLDSFVYSQNSAATSSFVLDDEKDVTAVEVSLNKVPTGYFHFGIPLTDNAKSMIVENKGKQVTVGFDFHNPGESGEIVVFISNSDGNSALLRITSVMVEAEGWTHVTVTGDIPASATVANQRLYVNLFKLPANATVPTAYRLCNFKLELGNKATDWTPAPEDVEADATVKADNALASAKTYTDAQLKVTSDSITSTVSKTYATKNSLTDYTKRSYLLAQGSGNTSKYMQICTMNVIAAYANMPIIITLSDRSMVPSRLMVEFYSYNGTDPTVESFLRDGDSKAYIVKLDTGTWGLYVEKSSSYALIDVSGYVNPMESRVQVTWTGVNTAELPSGNTIEATQLIGTELKDDYTTQTQMTQTSDEIRMDFTKSITSASNELQSKIAESDTATNQKFSEINKYIRFVDGKIVLGETGNELTLTIQNDRVSFTNAGVEVAYFSNNNLYVNRAEVLTTMKIGNYEFAPRNNGGLTLRKRGE